MRLLALLTLAAMCGCAGDGGATRINQSTAGGCSVSSVAASSVPGTTSITEFRIPTPRSDTHHVAVGPDGSLWFTEESGSNKVGKVTPSGVFAEYVIPTADSGPTGIATGPDGNLWIAELSAHQVAKLTMSGVFTEYRTPSGSGPTDVVAGSDGNLWFTEFDSRIAKVTTSGFITEYSLPLQKVSADNPFGVPATPDSIAAGPDGNLWFTELASYVGRITTSGVITEYP
ncbi:MAG TPA: hypothetical protein VHM88_20220, partial [Candidatus Acidoferrales bacterium]|nr:hypothetical protein [Candidatus Acidoferrales bacterium]